MNTKKCFRELTPLGPHTQGHQNGQKGGIGGTMAYYPKSLYIKDNIMSSNFVKLIQIIYI